MTCRRMSNASQRKESAGPNADPRTLCFPFESPKRTLFRRTLDAVVDAARVAIYSAQYDVERTRSRISRLFRKRESEEMELAASGDQESASTDTVEPRAVVGLRGWRLALVALTPGGGCALRGPTNRVLDDRFSGRAECLLSTGCEHLLENGHEIPNLECSCGYYAMDAIPPWSEHDISRTFRWLPSSDRTCLNARFALVLVSANRRTVVHSYGWRAESIRVDAIYLSSRSSDEIEEAKKQFGVPVHVGLPK